MRIVRYCAEKSQEWDAFVKASKNGTFLFLRGYMDYHADRFADHSLMYYSDKDKLLAVLPANETIHTSLGESERSYYSHQGLTYGGFILSVQIHTSEIGECFALTSAYLKEQGFLTWYYKQMPTIYHRQPAEDDAYWLWYYQAQLVDCSLMTVIPLRDHNKMELPVSSSRKNNSNRLQRLGYKLSLEAPIADFWPILTQNLQDRFGAKPVHTYDEIMLLQQRFPQRIRCCTVSSPDGEVLAGTLLYLSDNVAKAQYTSASPAGKQVKALDYLILGVLHWLETTASLQYFDFGTSMQANSTVLNDGLVLQKEGFGGRGIAAKIYKIRL